MKKAVYFLISLLLILSNNLYCKQSAEGIDISSGDSLKVLSTPELYNLSVKWVEEYNRLFPGVNLGVMNIADQEKAADLIAGGRIGFVSGEYYAVLKNETLWREVIGRDVIVSVINAKNPYLEDLLLHGISPDVLALFLKRDDSRTWADLLKNGKRIRADYYCINDESAIRSLAGFFGTEEFRVAGMNSGNTLEVVSAIQNDPYAIGFCKLINVLDFDTRNLVENIKLLPLDRNVNGIIDSNEKIYENVSNFTRGVWIGKYPKALFSNIYTVAKEQPENSNEVAFLKWVLSDGQKYLAANGYSDLLAGERQSAAGRLINAKISAGASTDERFYLTTVLFITGVVIIAGLIAISVARQQKHRRDGLKTSGSDAHPLLNEDSLKIPRGIYFDKTHTWAFLEANGNVKVGIDDFLQHVTGQITKIKMKSPGKKVVKGEEIFSIVQNGKQLNLYSPVSGTIVEQNMTLDSNSSSLNTSPYSEGWICRIEPSNWIRESQLLFMADRQREFIKMEFLRLKDFLISALGSDNGKYTRVIMQDGGEINDGVLSEMGPEIWEDFQTKFIDPSRQIWFYEII